MILWYSLQPLCPKCGRPCDNPNPQRMGGQCLKCNSERIQLYNDLNVKKRRTTEARYYAKNKKARQAYNRKRYLKIKPRHRAMSVAWKKANPQAVCAHAKKQQARKREQCSRWYLRRLIISEEGNVKITKQKLESKKARLQQWRTQHLFRSLATGALLNQ